MANEQNLKPVRNKKEARERGRKGGIASGEARRRAKTMKELAKAIANSEIQNDSLKKKVEKIFPADEETEITGSAAVVASVFNNAVKGNMKAVEVFERMAADDKEERKRFDLPARCIGESFVRINRHIEPNKSYILKGGRGSLKSSFISLKIIEILKNNPMMHACIVRKVAATLHDTVYNQMIWAINELGMEDEYKYTKHPPQIMDRSTGQIIYFRGVDEPTKLKGIKPPFGYVGILWKEEKDQLAGEEEERSVNQSVLRGGDISYDFSSYNPPKSKSNWVHKQLLTPDPKRVVHHSTYLTADPEWLGQKFLDDAEHLKMVNPEAYDHEYGGIANGEGGQVFEYLEIREIKDSEIATFDRIYQGVDWGWYPDIYAFVRVAYDHARDCVFFISEFTGNKMVNSKTGQWIIDKGYDDFPVTCDSSEVKSVNDYRDMGIQARPAVKGPGSVEYEMKWLQGRKIVIDPARTPTVFKEFTEYEYDRDREDNVISGYPDKNNHTIDATRYALEQFCGRRGETTA